MSEATESLEMAAGQLAAQYLESPEAQEQISKVVRNTVNKAIESSLGTYSDFGKQVTKSVEKALVIHGEIDLPSYNDLILKIIAAQVEHATREVIEKQVAGRVTELLKPAPENIRLSELVGQYIQYLKERESDGCVCYGERKRITFEVTDKQDGFLDVCLDSESGKKPRDCDIRIGIYKDSIYYLTFRDTAVEQRMFVGPLYGFQRSLFQMKAAKTKLLLDHEEVDIDLNYDSDHDD